jgi:hypothetical protein
MQNPSTSLVIDSHKSPSLEAIHPSSRHQGRITQEAKGAQEAKDLVATP